MGRHHLATATQALSPHSSKALFHQDQNPDTRGYYTQTANRSTSIIPIPELSNPDLTLCPLQKNPESTWTAIKEIHTEKKKGPLEMSRSGVPPGGSNNSGQKNILLKCILLGDGGVGKSCIMNRFVSNRFDAHSFHTIGVEFLNKEMEAGGQMYTLQIWDTAGQERFKSLRTPFYRGSDICLLTFSLDDRQSFNNLVTWREEFLYYADVVDKDTFPFVVLGNKVDIEPEKREVPYETVLDWCGGNGNLPYIETSAKESTNVQLAFVSALERWVKLDSTQEKPYTGQTVNIGNRTERSSTGVSSTQFSCCFTN